MQLTRAEYTRRHQYCVTTAEVKMALQETLRRHPDFKVKPQHKAVCDHPEDGFCMGPAGDDVTDDQLRAVNERHEPKQPPKVEKAATSGPKKPLPEGLKRWLEEQKRKKEQA